MQKMPPDCTQERVFCERTPSKKVKNFRLRRANSHPKTSFLNVSVHLKSQKFSFQKFVKKNLRKKKTKKR